MELFPIHSLIPLIFILIAWRVYRKPIKGDAALSIMWRGTLGGYAGGYLALYVFYGAHPYFILALIYAFILIPVFAMTFAGVVWMIQKRKPCGVLYRAVLGGAVGAVGGMALGWIIYSSGNNQASASDIMRAWGFSCLCIGMGAGAMAGPRKPPEPDEE